MPTAPGYAQVSIQMVHASMPRPSFVTFGVDPTDTDPALVAANVISSMNGAGSFQGLIDTNVTMRAVRVSLGVDGAEDLIAEVAMTMPGLKSGTKSPPNVAMLVHKRTSRGGRRGRGRMYIPWTLDTTDLDEVGVINGTVVTAKQVICTQWLTALGVNNVPMVLLHDPGLSPVGPPNPVTSFQVDTRVGTQRRRLGR